MKSDTCLSQNVYLKAISTQLRSYKYILSHVGGNTATVGSIDNSI